jgi:hypothetical protein
MGFDHHPLERFGERFDLNRTPCRRDLFVLLLASAFRKRLKSFKRLFQSQIM